MVHDQRMQSLLSLMAQNHLDGIALNPGPTLKYLTDLNFHLMERPFLLIISRNGNAVLVHPELESSKLHDSKIHLKGYAYGENPEKWDQVFSTAIHDLNINGKKIGIEPTHIRFLELQFLSHAAPDSKIIAANIVLDNLRIKKDPSEKQNIRQAAIIAQDAMEATIPYMKPGVTEIEIAMELSIQLLRAGSEPGFAFSPAVVAGPNSAKNHTGPGDRPLQKGDLIMIDWGAKYKGYNSDLTRTFAIGELDLELVKIYETVQAANDQGKKTARPGLPAGEVDKATRKIIESEGFGKYFTHRTGHGLGMEVHEPPYIYAENQNSLEEGMVFTVEPGIYLEGIGGVRIEDDVIITGSGCESLSDFPHDLRILD